MISAHTRISTNKNTASANDPFLSQKPSPHKPLPQKKLLPPIEPNSISAHTPNPTRKPPSRKRNIHFHLWATEEEAALIRSQFAKSGMTSLSAYFRKMAINGYHINIDLSDVRELVSLLRRSSNNINQMAKVANTTRSIFEADIKNLQRQYDKLWEAASEILRGLAKIK